MLWITNIHIYGILYKQFDCLGLYGANYHDALPVVFWRLLFCCKTRAEDVLAAINAIAVAEPMLIGLTPQLCLAASRLSVGLSV